MIRKEILEDLAKDCPCNGDGWCFLRELVPYIKFDERMAEQIRLAYDYKFMQSQKEGQDIGKERALKEFIEIYGKKFAEVYKDGMKHDWLFEAVFGFKPTHTDEEMRQHLGKV